MKKINKINLAISSALLAIPGAVLANTAPTITPVTISGTMTVQDVLMKVATWALGIVGIIAVLYLIWGGVLYITSAGNATKAETAKKTILHAVIGIIVILFSFAIVVFLAGNAGSLVND